MGGLLTELLASGPGWRASRVTCTSGPADAPFEEQHEEISVAAVLGGTFQYRCAQGASVLAPGSVLLGNAGACFECRHEHGSGDRCLCFHFTPETLADVARHVPGVTSAAFRAPVVQPSPRLIPLIAALESASEPAELEELGLRIAAHALSGPAQRPRAERVRRRDEKLVCDAVHSIERRSEDTLHVADLAAEAGVSTYRLLRLFARVIGMTPYQYLLRTRLHRAAVRIRCTRLPIARIAFEAGFNDLSTFNNRFRRTMGMSPRAYRRAQ